MLDCKSTFTSIWFTFTDTSKSCNICFIFYFCKQNLSNLLQGFTLFYSAFCFFIFAFYPGWLELAAALPIPRRKSYTANDAGRGSIHCKKMSNKVLRTWNWLENVAVHYYLELRGEGRSVSSLHLNVILVCFMEFYVRLNITEIQLVWVNGATSATKYHFFVLFSEVIWKSGQYDVKSACLYALYTHTHTHTHTHTQNHTLHIFSCAINCIIYVRIKLWVLPALFCMYSSRRNYFFHHFILHWTNLLFSHLRSCYLLSSIENGHQHMHCLFLLMKVMLLFGPCCGLNLVPQRAYTEA